MALFVDSLSHTEQLKDVVAYIRALTVARDGAESDDAVASKFAQLVADAATKSAEVLEFVISQGSLSFSHGSSESGTFVHDPTLSLRAFGSTMHRLVCCRVACNARSCAIGDNNRGRDLLVGRVQHCSSGRRSRALLERDREADRRHRRRQERPAPPSVRCPPPSDRKSVV